MPFTAEDWDEEMNDSGDEVETAKHFWRAALFDKREAWQNGAFYTAVDSSGNHMLKAFNYPKTGETGQLFGLQMGGFGLTIEPDANGVQKINNFKDFLVGPEPVTIACKAGKIVLHPGCMKMNGKSGVVWAFTQGPDKASAVPIHRETDDLKAGQGKKMSSASKRVVLKLPGGEEEGETVEAYVGRHQGKEVAKMDGTTLFEVGADGSELQHLAGGQANLLKLLKVPGLKLFLGLSKKIPGKPKGASLNIFAQHDEINDGNEILLFASAPVAGPPPHILAKGVLPGGKSLKDIMDLPWTYELCPVIEQLVKPLVDFAVYFDTCVAAKKWQKNVRGIPPRMAELVQLLSKLYKSQAKERVERLLSYVATNVGTLEDGEWRSSGLVLDPKVKAAMRGGKGKESDSGEESADESDVEELYVGGKGKAGKRTERSEGKSPAKSTRSSGSSSGGSVKKAKKAALPPARMAVGSGDEADELGGASDSGSDSDWYK